MTSKVTINRLATGVPGLDEVLGGGLPEFSFNLIAGQPGCGKTTLAHQMMFALATPERPALYFTVLGEPPLKMLRYQQQFDFFDTRGDQPIDPLRQPGGRHAWRATSTRCCSASSPRWTQHGPALVFVDSFRSVVLASETEGNPHNSLQQFVQQLGMLMTSWQATTFLIGEYFTETDANPVFTVADGLIWLRQSVQRNSMVRKMEIMKMRGQPTLPGLHTFRIGTAGIEVFAPASVAAAGRSQPNALPRAPTAADGRAAASTRCWAAACRAATRCWSPALRDRARASWRPPSWPRARAAARPASSRPSSSVPTARATASLADLIASGQVGLVDSRAPDLSIDEIVLLLMREIRRLERQPRRHRFAVGLRARAGADLPRGLSRIAVAPGHRAGRRRASPC